MFSLLYNWFNSTFLLNRSVLISFQIFYASFLNPFFLITFLNLCRSRFKGLNGFDGINLLTFKYSQILKKTFLINVLKIFKILTYISDLHRKKWRIFVYVSCYSLMKWACWFFFFQVWNIIGSLICFLTSKKFHYNFTYSKKWVFSCLTKFPFEGKVLLQIVQQYGRSPVWTDIMWIFRLDRP